MPNTADFKAALEEHGLSAAEAAHFNDEFWDTIAREMAVGEEVEVPGLGTFFTVKYPARQENGQITLPSVEAEFEPDHELVSIVKKATEDHPELFATEHPEEEDEDQPAPVPQASPPEAEAPAVSVPPPLTAAEQRTEEKPEEKPEPSAKPVKERPLGRASTIEFVDLAKTTVEKDVLSLVPFETSKRYNLVPIDLKEGTLTLAMINPEDFDAIQFIRKQTGLSVRPVLTSRDDLNAILDQYTGLQAEVQEAIAAASDLGISEKELAAASAESLKEEVDDNAPTTKIVGSLLKRAVKEHASDVHIEPYEGKMVVRFRIDGVLLPRVELPKAIQSAIIARLKILANLKIDEQRLPQDGRFSMTIDKREVDFRISTLPVVFGEKVVMRILDKQFGIRDLGDVGLIGNGLHVLEGNMRRSHGMILVTGPTGSGKTTSLYAVLGRLMKPDVNIITLEDPVEYRIESINQSQVHVDIGYSFASGLRSIVRQDPDIVMLGEIRDKETAEMAVQAALTGHVVLSTLHTNDAAGSFPRLIDMGIEPFLITSSIHTVIAQRLARMLDPDQRKERTLEGEELEEVLKEIEGMPDETKADLEKDGVNLKHPVMYIPVAEDGHNGYKGRIGIFEVLNVSEEIRSLILQRSSGSNINQEAVKSGMLTMVQDGIVKALKGLTSLEEVWRVTRE
jgi:type IV pilus assembly protein PilB